MSVKVAVVERLYPWEESNIDELEELCRTAGYQVAYRLTQRRYPHPQYNIGPSKLGELRDAVRRLGISKVIFENELKPLQEYNLAKELSVEIMTRTRLILEIFTLHASNIEAKLQIKLAELRYELPRAKERVKLAKMGEQPGFHGLGAYEADVYYEEISRRIQSLAKRLERLKARKASLYTQRRRTGYPIVSLAGYTNAGKSTLFNRLTRESVDVSPLMFTTLSTTTRLARIGGKPVYISDTVGFIRNVSPLLISSFMSTLREIAEADLVLLLLDATEDRETIHEKLSVSLGILREVGVTNTPIIIVLNKVDLLSRDEARELEEMTGREYPTIAISALTGENIEGLEKMMEAELRGFTSFEARVQYGPDALRLIDEAYRRGRVIEVTYDDGYLVVHAETPPMIAEKIRKISGDAFRLIDRTSKGEPEVYE